MSNLIKPELSIKTIGITIKKHLATPDISLDEHVRQCQIALAGTLENKRAIYLDVNFWNQITDASIGASNNSLAHELLGLLRELVSNGQIFCPISDSTFIEAFKQKIPHVRKATAHLIDELSLNVALIPFDMRVGTELAHFIHSSSTPASVYPLDQLVWSGLDPAMFLAMSIRKLPGLTQPQNSQCRRPSSTICGLSPSRKLWNESVTLSSRIP